VGNRRELGCLVAMTQACWSLFHRALGVAEGRRIWGSSSATLGSRIVSVICPRGWQGEIDWLAGIGMVDAMLRCVEGACD
jgi:hypothetical protein